MQAYHPSNQPYYPQTQYQPPQPSYYAAQYTPFPAYPQPLPGQQFPGVYPGHGPPDQYDSAFTPPAVRPRPLNRSQSAAVPSRKGPLKSILKSSQHERSASAGGPVAPQMSRSRTNSTSARPRANSSTRPRADPNPPFLPDHIFLSLNGTNEIRMENIAFQVLVDELREVILPMWPHGVTSEEGRHHRWRAQFAGNPWTCNGADGLVARKMICRLFTVLAVQGYSYLTTSNTSNPPARLIFGDSEPSPMAHFFSVSFSQSGEKISILDAPPMLSQNLSTNLCDIFPRRIASDRTTEDGLFRIELRKGVGASEVDKSLFQAYVLQYFNSAGYKLNGCLPVGKSSSFPLVPKKELWIFRGTVRRPTTPVNEHQ